MPFPVEIDFPTYMTVAPVTAIAPSGHDSKQLGTKVVNHRSQHALGLDARFSRRVQPQQVHHDVRTMARLLAA